MLPNGLKCRFELWTESMQRRGRWTMWSLCFFCPFEFGQSRFPALFQFSSHQTIVWIDPRKLPLSECRFVAQTLEMLLMGMHDLVSSCLLGCHRCSIDIQFNGRERLEKGCYHLQINWVCRNILADRDTILLAQVIAEIAGAMFVLHDHFVPALST